MRKFKFLGLLALSMTAAVFTACKDDDNSTALPPIGGYSSADEVAKADLVAYWSLNGDGKEAVSGANPSKSANVTWVDGVKGKAAKFDVGYLAYDAMSNLGENLETGFTISCWVNVSNNSTHPSTFFSLTRPNEWAGNINFVAETGWMPATSDSITIKGLLVSEGELGWQDIRNTVKASAEDLAAGQVAYANKIGGKWAHVVYTWDNTTKLAKVYANGVKISNPAWENRDATASKNFMMTAPTRPILGALETYVTGTSSDAWNTGLEGMIDEVRVWKRPLILSDIGALYDLEKSGR